MQERRSRSNCHPVNSNEICAVVGLLGFIGLLATFIRIEDNRLMYGALGSFGFGLFCGVIFCLRNCSSENNMVVRNPFPPQVQDNAGVLNQNNNVNQVAVGINLAQNNNGVPNQNQNNDNQGNQAIVVINALNNVANAAEPLILPRRPAPAA